MGLYVVFLSLFLNQLVSPDLFWLQLSPSPELELADISCSISTLMDPTPIHEVCVRKLGMNLYHMTHT